MVHPHTVFFLVLAARDKSCIMKSNLFGGSPNWIDHLAVVIHTDDTFKNLHRATNEITKILPTSVSEIIELFEQEHIKP